VLRSGRLPAALAGAALLLGLASCGGGDEEVPAPELSADEMLDRAFERPPESGRASIDLGAVLPQAPSERVATQLEGPFVTADGDLPSFDLAGEAEAVGFGVELRLVSTGDDAFVVFFGENYRVGPEQVAAIRERAAGVDPREWFGPARHAGTDEVDGEDAYLVEAPIRPDRVAADLEAVGGGGIADLRGLEGGTAEALIGVDDEVIRGLRVESEALELDLELSDLGEEQEIEPPPGGGFQPIEDLLERIPGL
jgi:hypothetical protein